MRKLSFIIALLLALFAGQAGAAAFVQSRSVNAGSVASIALAFTSSLGGGSCGSPSLLIVAVRTNGNRNSTIAISDTKTSTWTKDITDATNGTLHGWSAVNVASGADTVTVTWTTASTGMMAIHEYCGMLTSSAFDKTSLNSGASGTSRTSNSTATTTAASELIFGVERIASADTSWTPGGGATAREYVDNSGSVSFVTQDLFVSATGAYASTGTGTQGGSSWIMAVATYKASNNNIHTQIITGARRRR